MNNVTPLNPTKRMELTIAKEVRKHLGNHPVQLETVEEDIYMYGYRVYLTWREQRTAFSFHVTPEELDIASIDLLQHKTRDAVLSMTIEVMKCR